MARRPIRALSRGTKRRWHRKSAAHGSKKSPLSLPSPRSMIAASMCRASRCFTWPTSRAGIFRIFTIRWRPTRGASRCGRNGCKTRACSPRIWGACRGAKSSRLGVRRRHLCRCGACIIGARAIRPKWLRWVCSSGLKLSRRNLGAQMLTTSNWQNSLSRWYIPSPGVKFANNSDTGPDAGEGLLDWMDAGRQKVGRRLLERRLVR